MLVSFLCLYKYDIDTYECIAFTKINFRKKGYFKNNLEKSLLYLKKFKLPISKLYFYADENSKSALKTLYKLKASLLSKEFLMNINLDNYFEQINSSYLIKKHTEFNNFLEFKILFKNIEIGKFAILDIKNHCYFNSFEIFENFRNKGHGKNSFAYILSVLKKDYTKLSLQVNSNNTYALRIYQNMNFKTSKVLHTYCIYF